MRFVERDVEDEAVEDSNVPRIQSRLRLLARRRVQQAEMMSLEKVSNKYGLKQSTMLIILESQLATPHPILLAVSFRFQSQQNLCKFSLAHKGPSSSKDEPGLRTAVEGNRQTIYLECEGIA